MRAPDSELRRGRLIKAFVPHVGLKPMTLEVDGRVTATSHGSAKFKMIPMTAGSPPSAPKLPVAALPHVAGEVKAVYRAKRRPALVLSVGGDDLPDSIKRDLGWQAAPALLVAPYYGADQDGTRAGWPEPFVRRVSRGEYPQYAYDRLPIGGCNESILRLDHTQPIGNDPASYQLTEFELTADALGVIDEWFAWLVTGTLDPEGILDMLAGELAKLPE